MLIRCLALPLFAIPVYAQCGLQRICPADISAGSQFGVDVDIAGDIAAVGAFDHANIGRVFVLRRSETGVWMVSTFLDSPSGEPEQGYGVDVATNGNWLAVGEVLEDLAGPASGAVHLYERTGLDSWTFHSNLLPSSYGPLENLGGELYFDEDRLVVSAIGDDEGANNAGSVWIYELEDGDWVEQARLLTDQPEDHDNFGVGLGAHGEWLVVGARGRNDSGDTTGSAFVYRHDGGAWNLVSTLTAPDPSFHAEFGESVSIFGSRIVIGAYGHGNYTGAAYVYTLVDGNWVFEAKLTASDAAQNRQFGYDVEMASENRILIGTPKDNNGGSVYSFERNGGQWVEGEKLRAITGSSDRFGAAISADGGTLLTGAHDESCVGNESGALHVHGLRGGLEYCEGGVNSLGLSSRVFTSGSTSIGANELRLIANNAPPGQFGIFCYGPGKAKLPLGQGFLCLDAGSSGIFRLPNATQVQPDGTFERLLDFSSLPMSGGPGEIVPGASWNFQLWYRDGNASNLSNAVSVTFCP